MQEIPSQCWRSFLGLLYTFILVSVRKYPWSTLCKLHNHGNSTATFRIVYCGTFHAKMGLIKDRNGMDLTEAEAIKKRWQEYTEELYKKDLHDQDNHDGTITHLEPDILECEVKWALESITTNKARGDDRIPVEPFQILKDDAVKVLHSICQKSGKLSSGHRTGKGQFLF